MAGAAGPAMATGAPVAAAGLSLYMAREAERRAKRKKSCLNIFEWMEKACGRMVLGGNSPTEIYSKGPGRTVSLGGQRGAVTIGSQGRIDRLFADIMEKSIERLEREMDWIPRNGLGFQELSSEGYCIVLPPPFHSFE